MTEDSAKDALDVLAALLRKVARLVVPDCETHRIGFTPADEDGRAAMHGHMHAERGSDGHRRRAILAKQIVTQLCRSDIAGFVAYHTDGDCVWSRRATSVRMRQFEQLREVVRKVLQNPPAGSRLPADAAARIDRVLLVAPFFEIESWLYQNTAAAVAICEREYRGRDAEKFSAWAADRALLDEISDTKDQTCLRDKHNRELAEHSWPAAEVHRAGTSFATTVERMRACDAFVAALAQAAGL